MCLCFKIVVFVMFCYMTAGAAIEESSCEFPPQWAGLWFQSGVRGKIEINSTAIGGKGVCIEKDKDKFLIHDQTDDCYRCVIINLQHPSVLQYKETFCYPKGSLQEICEAGITGDAPLFSMFRSEPKAEPEECPFKGAPFTFTYSRGQGDCTNPPSRAESCTDDSRLILKYQACPDIRAAESTVEELICLAVWREGSTRYMVGRVLQQDRHNSHPDDEEQYRCFIYERVNHQGNGHHNGITYNIAQSGDASCSGLQNANEGSKTIKLTTVDDHHNRCRFPLWLTEHHTWHSLDHRLSYQFSQRNATLKVKNDEYHHPGSYGSTGGGGSSAPYGVPLPYTSDNGGDLNNGEPYHSAHTASASPQHHHNLHAAHLAGEGGTARLICHSILQSLEKKKVQIVAHVTTGCKSGHVCMVFYKRDNNVIEVQQSTNIVENPDEACRGFNPATTPFTTLITASLHSKKCPHLGRYTVDNSNAFEDKRTRRQNIGLDNLSISKDDCKTLTYESFSVGCSGSHEAMEQKARCPHSNTQITNTFSCHGSWEENGTSYLIASPIADTRKASDPHRYCFIFDFNYKPDSSNALNNIMGGTSNPSYGSISRAFGVNTDGSENGVQRGGSLRLTAIADNCHRITSNSTANESKHVWTMNLTTNGSCADADGKTSFANTLHLSAACFLMTLIITIIVIR